MNQTHGTMTGGPRAETMLFRSPGSETIWGVSVDTATVPDAQVDALLADGWHLTVEEADAARRAQLAEKLAAAEAEKAALAAQLAAGGQVADLVGGEAPAAPPPALRPVHKGNGVWALVDGDGNVVRGGLTRAEAHAA